MAWHGQAVKERAITVAAGPGKEMSLEIPDDDIIDARLGMTPTLSFEE
jgi:hypothetical protein